MGRPVGCVWHFLACYRW
uniref:Uncharacterized protein n=1 Tax=Arundo donax TaxID=35708 RepID=A0A0A9FIF6_ARUDO